MLLKRVQGAHDQGFFSADACNFERLYPGNTTKEKIKQITSTYKFIGNHYRLHFRFHCILIMHSHIHETICFLSVECGFFNVFVRLFRSTYTKTLNSPSLPFCEFVSYCDFLFYQWSHLFGSFIPSFA